MTSKLTGEGDDDEEDARIAIFGYKHRLMSIDMKTKLVQQSRHILKNILLPF